MILVKDILVLCLALAAKTLRYDMGGSYIGALGINLSIQMLYVLHLSPCVINMRYKQPKKQLIDPPGFCLILNLVHTQAVCLLR